MRIVIVTLLMSLITGLSFSQEIRPVSKKDLKQYVVVQDSLEDLKFKMTIEVNRLIKSEPLMKSGIVYSDLQRYRKDKKMLDSLKIDMLTIKAYDKIVAAQDSMNTAFTKSFPLIINEMMGFDLYSNVTKALHADPEVKKRYRAMVASLNE